MTTTENNWLQEISESFGLIFLLERRLEYIFDKIFAPHHLTTKQWLVLAAIEKLCDEKPSIQEVAKVLATSHQNIKAIALNLQKSGFINLEKDHKDKRVTRLAITSRSKAFWQQRETEDKALLVELFRHVSDKQVVMLHQTLSKLLEGADEFTERLKVEKENGDT